MRAMLKSLFATKTVDLEAKLAAATGQAKGEFDFAQWSNGDRVCEIELSGLSPGATEVRVNGALLRAISTTGAKMELVLSTRRGDLVPELGAGGRIEVRQNGALILEGVLSPN